MQMVELQFFFNYKIDKTMIQNLGEWPKLGYIYIYKPSTEVSPTAPSTRKYAEFDHDLSHQNWETWGINWPKEKVLPSGKHTKSYWTWP